MKHDKIENGYIAFYRHHRYEVYADSLLEAKDKAVELAMMDYPRHSLRRMRMEIAVALAELGGEEVVHDPGEL